MAVHPKLSVLTPQHLLCIREQSAVPGVQYSIQPKPESNNGLLHIVNKVSHCRDLYTKMSGLTAQKLKKLISEKDEIEKEIAELMDVLSTVMVLGFPAR